MPATYAQREKLFVRLILLCCAVVLTHFVHLGWIGYLSGPQVPMAKRVIEPDFRIAMPALLSFVTHISHGHISAIWAATISDMLFSFLAFNVLYDLTIAGFPSPARRSLPRLLTVCIFLVFLQFPLAFVVPWQRPETMPSTLFLAFALLCLYRSRNGALWTVALIAATILQTFIRADVAIVFGLALLLLSFAKNLLNGFGSRTANVLRAVLILAISGSFQFYVQFIKFHDVHYSKGSPILANLNPHILSVFLVAALPFALMLFFLWQQKRSLTAIEAFILAVAVLYFPFYFCLGILGEVRIYVPFFFCLCVVAARISASYLLAEDVMNESTS